MKKLSSVLFVVVFLFTLSGCATMEGLGKDIEKLGESIQKSVDE